MPQSSDIYSVGELVSELRNLLESSYRSVWIEGEISSLATPASGHLYFSLKEANAVIRCAFFRNRRAGSETPKEGMQVLIRGQISVYENRGDLQLIVSHLEPAGEGALRRAFEALKKKLLNEGLFDAKLKQDPPHFPFAVGVITSISGAALHDVRITLKRRYPLARLIVYPCVVQGEEAVKSICDMFAISAQRAEVDVIILARGGGSLEDLQAFNDESVARAIFACPIPVVTGIGHETDLTIADLVADQRAATPTAAAESVSPPANELARNLRYLQQRIVHNAERHLDQLRQQVDYACAKLVHPTQRLDRYGMQRAALQSSLVATIRQILTTINHDIERAHDTLSHNSPARRLIQSRRLVIDNRRRLRQQSSFHLSKLQLNLKHLTSTLRLMSPLATLDRGYSILQDEKGDVVSSVKSVESGQELLATVSDGKFNVKINPKQQ